MSVAESIVIFGPIVQTGCGEGLLHEAFASSRGSSRGTDRRSR